MQSSIQNAEVVIFWGKNPQVESSELISILRDKKIIVIDPIKTEIAKMADHYISIKPRGDFFLAMLLCRFLYIYDSADEEFLRDCTSGFEDFYELTQSIRIVSTLKEIDVDLGDIERVLELVQDKKVAIVYGEIVHKHSDGDDFLQATDAFIAMLGLLDKKKFDTSSGKFEFMEEFDSALPSKLNF